MALEKLGGIDWKQIERCFYGTTPATISTCSPEGIPNVTFLSIVHFLDEQHLGLSFQFFNKTRENIRANPRALILLIDPGTGCQFRIDVLFVRTETEGPAFERMRANLSAVASQTGMTHVFRLRGLDVYRVLGAEKLVHDLDLEPPDRGVDLLASLEAITARMMGCDELESLLTTTLSGLAELFSYPASMILLADGAEKRLFTVASAGFPDSGVGAELRFGDGLIGTAALERRSVRVSDLRRDRAMAAAVRGQMSPDEAVSIEPIPLPGLPDAVSQIATPILARDRTLGVLSVQSREAGALTPRDEQALTTIARQLATAILLLQEAPVSEAPEARTYARGPIGEGLISVRHHAVDDSVFIDGDYLIRGLSGRILLRVLEANERDGRVDFSHKELRLDPAIQLGLRDNLEARLVLLRQRLLERDVGIRLVKTGRGRFRLELAHRFRLERIAPPQ